MATERAGATTLRGQPMTLIGPALKVGDTAPKFTIIKGREKYAFSPVGERVRILSVVPSLDTPVCDQQTRRFNEEAAKLPNVEILTISVDLPAAQGRWCGAAGIDKVACLSDHYDTSFGQAYGVLIKELRLLSRAIFVVGKDGKLKHVEYVMEVGSHPNYEAAIEAAKKAA
ncbi:MAG: thiol peroxidase [Myxococcales bacterium]|nr:thiol peroxidase [Myxococcales bacterium]